VDSGRIRVIHLPANSNISPTIIIDLLHNILCILINKNIQLLKLNIPVLSLCINMIFWNRQIILYWIHFGVMKRINSIYIISNGEILSRKSKRLVERSVFEVRRSTVAASRKPFGIGYIYIYISLIRMTDTMTSQNTDLCSRDTLYIAI
jgi:hypothetical protein